VTAARLAPDVVVANLIPAAVVEVMSAAVAVHVAAEEDEGAAVPDAGPGVAAVEKVPGIAAVGVTDFDVDVGFGVEVPGFVVKPVSASGAVSVVRELDPGVSVPDGFADEDVVDNEGVFVLDERRGGLDDEFRFGGVTLHRDAPVDAAGEQESYKEDGRVRFHGRSLAKKRCGRLPRPYEEKQQTACLFAVVCRPSCSPRA
jgi:hypothetical protein